MNDLTTHLKVSRSRNSWHGGPCKFSRLDTAKQVLWANRVPPRRTRDDVGVSILPHRSAWNTTTFITKLSTNIPTQQAQQSEHNQSQPKSVNTSNKKMAAGSSSTEQHRIPEHEIKQNSGVSATMALQAAQKAWELRQAANAAGDPNAREEILAKAINKEIEAESFGKAAKYTRSGAFQGLAAGAGLGVQPGVTLGKLTGALVGGVVSTVTGLLGGGIGSVYGAMNGPFWDLGEMASKGVRGVIGDFPNWKSTPSQKKALEKMVMQTRDTQAPTQEELEQMKKDAPDDMPQSWSQSMNDMTSWRPSMPNMPSMPTGAALGLGGLGASMPSWGGQGQNSSQQQAPPQAQRGAQPQKQQPSQDQSQRPRPATRQSTKQANQEPQEPPKPKEAPTPKEAPKVGETASQKPAPAKNSTKTQAPPKSKTPSNPKPEPTPAKEAPKPQSAKKPTPSTQTKTVPSGGSKGNKPPMATNTERRKPRKLASKGESAQSSQTAPKKTPRKLESRKPAA